MHMHIYTCTHTHMYTQMYTNQHNHSSLVQEENSIIEHPLMLCNVILYMLLSRASIFLVIKWIFKALAHRD